MCMRGEFEYVTVNGRKVKIDKCLVPIIKGLNSEGIMTVESCCGHGETEGHILAYQDGEPRLFVVYEIGKKSLDIWNKHYRRLAEISEEKTKMQKPPKDKMIRSTENK